MKYFIVHYRRVMAKQGHKMQEQMDEVVSVKRNIRKNDIQTAAVILDFSKQTVLQASLEGKTVPRDWWRIRDFYHQHYPDIIERLETANGLKIVQEKTASPDTDSEHQ
jgi:hypothetical protein